HGRLAKSWSSRCQPALPLCPQPCMKPAIKLWLLLLCAAEQTGSRAEAPQWHQESGFAWAALNVPAAGKTGFRLLPPEETGINFTNTLELRAGEANRVLFNGSGVAVG